MDEQRAIQRLKRGDISGLVLSGVAYALGRAFGYIPGIGLVEQTASLRTLEASVSAERAGIRLTVTNVIASPTSTSIRFQVEWLNPPPTTGDFDASCQGTPSLILPDGTGLSFVQTTQKFSVGEPGSNAGYGYVMEFAPVPADQSEVTFLYPCIAPLIPGPLPRDWQIPIHLLPAPAGMAFPVVTMPATEAPTPSNATLPAVDPTHRIALSIDSFVPMEDGYLLIGSMQWSANDYPAYGVKPVPYMGYIKVVDSKGQDVAWEEIYENVKPQNEANRSYWAIRVLSTTFAPPLTITLSAADVQIQPVAFQVDVGSAPQAGQSWDINQDIEIVDSLAHILKANLISYEGNLNFQLEVQVDANVIGDVYISTPLNQCMGGGGGYPTEHSSTLQIYVPMCRPDLPPGIAEMQVTGVVLWGQWQVSWQP
ncbi:MAG TPA: hypothetical protein VK249_25945 [Anaerolineales bacterium]|nr:hypothetical protein [Anaerolineales bacterium]